MIDSGDFKRGDCIVYKGAPMTIVDVTFSTPSARGAGVIVKTKLRNLISGQLLVESLRTGEKFEEADLERHPCSYMYSDGTRWHFMDETSFEQFEMGADDLGDAVGYMKDGLEGLQAMLIDGSVVSLSLPMTVDLVVTETDPAIKGATAKAQMKPATLETGLVIQVPPYLTTGECVRVDTRDGHFVERVKS
jgi:elongation factor P